MEAERDGREPGPGPAVHGAGKLDHRRELPGDGLGKTGGGSRSADLYEFSPTHLPEKGLETVSHLPGPHPGEHRPWLSGEAGSGVCFLDFVAGPHALPSGPVPANGEAIPG